MNRSFPAQNFKARLGLRANQLRVVAMSVPERQLFIQGEFRRPCRGGRIPVVNPATEEQIGSIPAGTHEDVDLAVAAAQTAVDAKQWTTSSGAHRATVLRAIAEQVIPQAQVHAGYPCQRPSRNSDLLRLLAVPYARAVSCALRRAAQVRQRKSDLARLECLDCGKPIAEAEWDMVRPALLCTWIPTPLPSVRRRSACAAVLRVSTPRLLHDAAPNTRGLQAAFASIVGVCQRGGGCCAALCFHCCAAPRRAAACACLQFQATLGQGPPLWCPKGGGPLRHAG